MCGRRWENTSPHCCSWHLVPVGGPGWTPTWERACGAAAPTETGGCDKPTSPPSGYLPSQLQRCSCCAWPGHHGPTAAGHRGPGWSNILGRGHQLCCNKGISPKHCRSLRAAGRPLHAGRGRVNGRMGARSQQTAPATFPEHSSSNWGWRCYTAFRPLAGTVRCHP